MIPIKSQAAAKRRPKSKSIAQHTDGKEYVVCLKEGIDYDTFWNQMETTVASPHTVPDRAVRVANERVNMKRICNYILTDAEAQALRSDSRVTSVDIPVQHKDHVEIRPHATQRGNFSKPYNTTVSSGNLINWGLIRGNTETNVYHVANEIDTTYDYTLDATGVDVVVMDTGIQADHPEFQDAQGNSRLQQINWFTASDTTPQYTQADLSDPRATINSDSYVAFDAENTGAVLSIGRNDLSSMNISVQNEEGRAYRLRFVGNSIWYRQDMNDIHWEMRLLDNNWIEVAILRHDAATRHNLQGLIATSGRSNVEIYNVNTTGLYVGQTIRFYDANNWNGYSGTVRHLGGDLYAMEYVENEQLGLDDLAIGLRLESSQSLGGTLSGPCLIYELNANVVHYQSDGHSLSWKVSDLPINMNKIRVLVDGTLQNIVTDYTITYDINNATFVNFTNSIPYALHMDISWPRGFSFSSTSSCHEGPVRFNLFTGNGDDSIINHIDGSTITVTGYDGGNLSCGNAKFFVGAYNSMPNWYLTNEHGDIIVNLSDLASTDLFGPHATTVSFLLKSDNSGVSWTRQGGLGNNYKAQMIDDQWVAVPGMAQTVGEPLVTVLSDTWQDFVSPGFTTPFSFKAPFTGFVAALHYTDVMGHGTHVAGIAAGKTYGWAKNANIYAIKLRDLSGNGGLTIDEAFSALIGWHNRKTNGRPTVVNMSWGYGYSYDLVDITGGSYRGYNWTGNLPRPEYGMGLLGTFPLRDFNTDIGIEEMAAVGIHVCISAGNDGIKIDVPGGADYNNYFTYLFMGDIYRFNYQQGSSPYSQHAHMVGSLDSVTYDAAYDRKAYYSNGGPGVDIYTPGTAIMSSMSTVNTLADEGYEDAAYFLDGAFKQANLSGTSMASPELAGMIAVWLQANPHATPAQMKAWVLNNASSAMWTYNSNGIDYEMENSVWGGQARIAYNKFHAASALTVRNIQP